MGLKYLIDLCRRDYHRIAEKMASAKTAGRGAQFTLRDLKAMRPKRLNPMAGRAAIGQDLW